MLGFCLPNDGTMEYTLLDTKIVTNLLSIMVLNLNTISVSLLTVITVRKPLQGLTEV